jgi:hypothetical protein
MFPDSIDSSPVIALDFHKRRMEKATNHEPDIP